MRFTYGKKSSGLHGMSFMGFISSMANPDLWIELPIGLTVDPTKYNF